VEEGSPFTEHGARLVRALAELASRVGIELVPDAEGPVRQQELLRAALSAVTEEPLDPPIDAAWALRLMFGTAARLEPESPSRSRLMTTISRFVFEEVTSRQDPAFLDEAVGVMRQVTTLGPADDPDLPNRLNCLSETLRRRFDARGAISDLREAVDATRTAVRVHPESDPFHPRLELNLAVSQSQLAQWTGDDGLLDEAVGTARSAVRKIPAGDRDRPLALHKLAVMLADRYLRAADARDLDASIEHRRTALAAWEALGTADPAAVSEQDRDLFRSGLSNSLRLRFLRFDDKDDLAEAIALGRELVPPDASTEPWTGDPGPMTNLASALMFWGEREPDPAALDEAVVLFRRVRDGSAGTALAARHLGNLGLALSRRFRMAGDVADLTEAIALHEQAASQIDPEQPDLAEHLAHAARALWDRFEAAGDRTDLDRACALYERAASRPTGGTSSRVSHAYAWGRARAQLGEWDSAQRGFTLAVELLPRLALHRLSPADQAELMRSFFGLASAGASCALQAGDPAGAVALLEHGRAVLAEQLLGADEDLALLNDRDPALARRFEDLRESLDGRGGAGDGRGAVHAWNQTLRAIREVVPGFFRPPSTADLLGRLGGRTVVLLNTSPYRSDCLVLKDGAITVVPLTVLVGDFTEQASRLLHALGHAFGEDPEVARQTGEEELLDVLDWVWEKVGKPVMESTGFLAAADGRTTARTPPRLWWIPCGMSGFLPLHAAGRRLGPADGDAPAGGPRSVPECVISSYAPTLRSLLRTRGPAAPDDRPALVVAAPEDDLPGVTREIGVLAGLVPVEVLAGPEATVEAVKERLPDHPVVHFACHGVRDPEDPGASRFLLPASGRGALTVRDLVALRLPSARLAYLSVCSTALAATTAIQLVDEALTLSASMHVAGFRNVIGALWPVNDLIAVRLVRDMYRSMRSPDGPASIDADLSAEALHTAVTEFRRVYPELPSLWASHVHVGG
jgi:tetratricopeptide (TPR) repeat protein